MIYLLLILFFTFWCFTQAVTGQEESVEALLQRGASVCVRDIRGHSPLHLASACGRVGVLGALLQAMTTSTHTQTHLTDNQGYTPLHWACYNGTGTQQDLLEIHVCSVWSHSNVVFSSVPPFVPLSSLCFLRIRCLCGVVVRPGGVQED